MSVNCLNLVLGKSRARGTARHVLTVIAWRLNDAKQCAWPSYTTLCHECGISRRKLSAALKELVELGELTIEGKGKKTKTGRGKQAVNVYRIDQQRLRSCHREGSEA